MPTLTVLGGGKMGEALLGGLVASGWSASDLAVVEKVDARRDELRERFPGLLVCDDPAEGVEGADTVVVAVKPGDVAEALRSAAATLAPAALVLSIAAGVRIAALEELAPGRPVVRVMPNTPALVGLAASAVAGGTHATSDHLAVAEDVLGGVGIVVRLPEDALDAVTGLSGSGPAYLFYLAEALVQGGLAQGLPADVADRLVRQTLLGAATLLAESGEDPERLRAAVTSPGGTTERAVEVLDGQGAREAFVEAVAAATRRSRELGAG